MKVNFQRKKKLFFGGTCFPGFNNGVEQSKKGFGEFFPEREGRLNILETEVQVSP